MLYGAEVVVISLCIVSVSYVFRWESSKTIDIFETFARWTIIIGGILGFIVGLFHENEESKES